VPTPVPQNQRLLDALENPVSLTAASIDRGRDRYDIYCTLCHGTEGLGNGPVAPKLANAVRNLRDDRVRRSSDGWIYGVVVHGYGTLMPEYGSKIRNEDRWHIVNYVRVLQGATP
jgi:mono/diheme cytochrome c family protein